jgi:serine protease AprX
MKDMATAVRGDDVIASYSSNGPTLLDHVVKPDLLAPGNKIVSALAPGSAIMTLNPGNVDVSCYKNSNTVNMSNYYFRMSRTSIAPTAAAIADTRRRESRSPESGRQEISPGQRRRRSFDGGSWTSTYESSP